MDWIRENKQVATLMGVFLAAAIGVGVLLFNAYSSYSGALERFNQTNNGLAAMKSADLFPSQENLMKKKKAVEEYEGKVSKLNAVLMALQPAVDPITETDFQAKLKSKIAEVKVLAGKATALPVDFALSFPEYTGSLPKSAAVAKQLSGYLDATDAVVRKMIEAGVASIDTLERSPLQVESGVEPETAGGREANVVERRTLTTTLTLDQPALQSVLNALASPSQMNYFTAVRLLRIENEAQEGPLRSAMQAKLSVGASDNLENAVPDQVGVESDPAADGPKAEVLTAAKPLEPDAVAVLGGEKLKAYLEIDLVDFISPQPEETPAPRK